ncbi:hypothetical protein [Blastomonas aquatica]|uniref:Uncharacterized protein n=1 Tax=Blastomonas aquatica TaxID=1510276 RepID=A0ABQ1J2R8_9SPHN|nr:hypothetical protein [Blastomonas aquatica]GGB57423.1 hypothetical protein GCM10010833_10190 [Blastomonas aquatica]
MNRTLAIATLTLGLAACAAPQQVAAPARPVVPSRSTTLSEKGLEAIIGKSVRDLERMFGQPRLDVREFDARKLQFVGSACVLDAFLYPEGSGGTQVVTYIDARRSDGQSVDRAACVEALKK